MRLDHRKGNVDDNMLTRIRHFIFFPDPTKLNHLDEVLAGTSRSDRGQPTIAHVKATSAMRRLIGGKKDSQTFNVNRPSQPAQRHSPAVFFARFLIGQCCGNCA